MFENSEFKLLASCIQNLNMYSCLPPNMMQFVLSCAFPLLSDIEKQQMVILKSQYEERLKDLMSFHDNKSKIAMDCIQFLNEAIRLYDQAFNRVANDYFGSIYN